MSKKIKASISVDANIWDLAKDKLEMSRSEFIQQQLEYAIGLSEDEENELRKQILEHQEEINVLESKLCKIREEKLKQEVHDGLFEHVHGIVVRIHDRMGVIGENQLKRIANQNNVPFKSLYNFCMDNDFNLVKYAEVPI